MKILTLSYQDKDITLNDSGDFLTIGRSELNDLVLYDQTVSERHGQIVYDQGHFLYQDMNSRNGTRIMDGEGTLQLVNNATQVLPTSGKIILGSRSGPNLKFNIDVSSRRDEFVPAGEIGSLFEEGLSSLKTRAYDTAFKNFETLIQTSPREIDLYYYAGFSAWHLNRLDDAILRFQQYLMIRPEDSRVMTDLGKIYERMGWVDKARHSYLQAIRTVKRCPEAEKLLKNLERFRGYGASPCAQYKTVEILNTGEKNIHQSPHFTVTYLCDHLDILKLILKELEIAYLTIGEFLDFYPKQKINVQLVADTSEPSGKTNAKGIVFYVSSYHMGEKNFLSVLVQHEYSHYALGSLTRFSKAVPWWFHEGFAQVMSQNIIPDRLINLKTREQVQSFPDLDSLKDVPRGISRQEMSLAYLVAHGAITYLVKSHGPEKLAELIHAFIETDQMITAFTKVKVDYMEFKKQVSVWLFNSAKTGRIKQTQRIV